MAGRRRGSGAHKTGRYAITNKHTFQTPFGGSFGLWRLDDVTGWLWLESTVGAIASWRIIIAEGVILISRTLIDPRVRYCRCEHPEYSANNRRFISLMFCSFDYRFYVLGLKHRRNMMKNKQKLCAMAAQIGFRRSWRFLLFHYSLG